MRSSTGEGKLWAAGSKQEGSGMSKESDGEGIQLVVRGSDSTAPAGERISFFTD